MIKNTNMDQKHSLGYRNKNVLYNSVVVIFILHRVKEDIQYPHKNKYILSLT